jgi:UDP-N-acetylmuramoyl-tripeptide--D-alanyl-D-alanine ligase
VESRSFKFIADACEGELLSGPSEALISRVCTDSRQAQVGDLFVAIVGEKFDAHDYLVEVARKGAAALLVARAKAGKASSLSGSVGIIAVEDTRLALGRLAARYRADFKLPVVAIGGSNGKTTTKELLASVLRQKFNTLWSEASFNNDIGVPLTLLKLEHSHGAAVIEVGTNHPGELPPLIRIVQPQFGVLTNIGREHLEFFGNLDGVAREEGWLAEFLPASGKLFINGDNDWTPKIVRRTKAAVVTVGLGEGNEWRARNVRVGEDGVRFDAESPQSEFTGEYRLRVLGRHQVPNALLALAAGRELGATPEQARRGLAECASPKMRLQIWEANGVRVLDDTYNANADSMLAALQTLHDLPCSGRRVAVLGDMAELGSHTAEAHREIGQCSVELGVDCLVTVGKFARETAQAAEGAGLKDVSEFPDVPTATAAVKRIAKPGDVVLLKASRATGLEKVGEALRATP